MIEHRVPRWTGRVLTVVLTVLLAAGPVAATGAPVQAAVDHPCHLLHGQGGRIGPDITGSNRADLEYLLANLLDPSAVVGRDYQTTTVLTSDGRSIAGIVIKETPTSVTLQTPTEQVTVALDDETMRQRIEALPQFEPKIKKGYLARYARMVTSANTGAVLKTDF